MSRVLKRLSTVGVAAGTALVMVAVPAGANADASISASEPGQAAAPVGASTAASVEGAQGAVTGEAASHIQYRISNTRCFSNAVAFNATTFENGRSGVQQFQQTAQLQEFRFGRWINRSGVARVNSTRFPNDFRSFTFTRQWQGRHVVNGASWRVKWQGLYANGAGRVIGQTPLVFVTCL